MARRGFGTLSLALSTLVLSVGTTVVARQHDSPAPAPATTPAPAPAVSQTPKAATPAPTPARTAAPAAHPKPPDVKTVIDRIQRRIDAELGPQSTTAKPKTGAAGRPAGPTTPGAPRRIHLAWRVSLIWPDELTRESTPAAPATVVWP